MQPSFAGLIAAVHTPFNAAGQLTLTPIERQAEHLLKHRVAGVFVGGTTGECVSLSTEERMLLTKHWSDVVAGTPLKLLVQVGAHSLPDAQALARQAQELGVDAISAMAPSYFRPTTTGQLVEFCRLVAEAAPGIPFYFYEIPVMTNVRLPMAEFLIEGRRRIPTLRGMKYSNMDLVQLQECLALGSDFDILFGHDELLLAAMSLGIRGAVGATYNFAAELYLDLMSAFERGDWNAARANQLNSVRLVRVLCRFGFMSAAKATMELIGIGCGSVRSPLESLTGSQIEELRHQLDQLGVLDEPFAPYSPLEPLAPLLSPVS